VREYVTTSVKIRYIAIGAALALFFSLILFGSDDDTGTAPPVPYGTTTGH
jgi:hypothetical protein